MFAVISALNSPPIIRLNQTIAELGARSKEIMTSITTLVSPVYDYKAYREFLGITPLPCIPYLGVILDDILVIEQRYPEQEANVINFHKMQLLLQAITFMQSYQRKGFNFQPVYQIITFLNNFPRIDMKELLPMSHKCEP